MLKPSGNTSDVTTVIRCIDYAYMICMYKTDFSVYTILMFGYTSVTCRCVPILDVYYDETIIFNFKGSKLTLTELSLV